MKHFLRNKNSGGKDKSTDKFFIQNILVMIVCTLLCIGALSGATWAWFNTSVLSSSQRIELANCTIDVKIYELIETTATGDENDTSPSISIGNEVAGAVDGDVTSFTLGSGKYSVVLKASGTASTCYSKVRIDGGTDLITQQISIPNEQTQGTLTFNLVLTLEDGESVGVTFETGFGISSCDDEDRSFRQDGTYSFVAAASATEPEDEPDEPASEPESVTESEAESAPEPDVTDEPTNAEPEDESDEPASESESAPEPDMTDEPTNAEPESETEAPTPEAEPETAEPTE